MCGIFGCCGRENLIKHTLDSLKILEYRGYDSAGITYLDHKQLITIKTIGDSTQLASKVKAYPKTDFCIGHTRWATNGAVCEQNAHPHLSANQNIAVVHNGIIENYVQCRDLLSKHHITLQTTVDTEVIPNILYLLQNKKHDIHRYLQGQYVFCALINNPQKSLFIAKKGHLPLYLGRSESETFVTSDTLAFPPNVTQFISLNDHDTGEITTSQIKFYHNGHPVTKKWEPFSQKFTPAEKEGFNTFMEKEINEIPAIIHRIVHTYQQDKSLHNKITNCHQQLATIKCLHLCGCGTSYHAALILANLFEKYCHLRAIAHISSELTPDTLLPEPSLALIISQSGETADTLSALEILKKHKIPIIALCNVTSSTIAQQSTVTFPLLCGPEMAVASTKVFVASVLVGCHLIGHFAPNDLQDLSQIAKQMLQIASQMIPLPPQPPARIFFIGKGLDYFLALEAALKVKEVTYLHCEGYPANELKHGPLSMVDHETLALVYQSMTTDNAISEITARGGQTISIPNPAPTNPLAFITKIIPVQIFALRLAEQRQINPDKPRNLAKSVTVL